MEKKSKKHFLLNLFTKFSVKGDVVNGDKYVFKMSPSLKEDLLKIINKNDENYSDFYKNYISKFDELDNYAFSLFYPNLIKEEFSVKSKPLILGKKIINWIYGLEKFPTKDIEEFYKLIKVEYKFSNDTAIVKRWNANIAYFNNDLKRASDNYSMLYDDLKDVDSIPKWYIDDICIDGRNILHQYGNTQNTHYYNNKYQDKISSNPHKLSYPDVDRIKINIYENVSKHIFNNKNKAKYTIIYGAGLEEIFKEIQNLVYLTIFYGSITHLKLIRELISDIMYMYAETFEDEQFYKLSLKMLFISGKYKEFRNLYNKLKLNYSFVNSEEFIKDILNSRKSLFGFEINRNSNSDYLIDILKGIIDNKENSQEIIEFAQNRYNSLLKEKKKIRDSGPRYKKLYNLLINNSVYINYCKKMNDLELLNFITQYISVSLPPNIDQEKFNDLVKVGIKEDKREALWRLAFNYNKRKKDFTLIEDYFIEKRDAYYLLELISAVNEDLNMDKLIDKVVATKDKKFIMNCAIQAKKLYLISEEDYEKYKEKYKDVIK